MTGGWRTWKRPTDPRRLTRGDIEELLAHESTTVRVEHDGNAVFSPDAESVEVTHPRTQIFEDVDGPTAARTSFTVRLWWSPQTEDGDDVEADSD